MKDFNNLTSAELYKLAKEKELEENTKVRPKVVLPNNSPSNITLIVLAEDYMNEEESGQEIDTQYAYETLMTVVYGEGVFDYINSLR